MRGPSTFDVELLDAVSAEAPLALEFLSSLVAQPSLRGNEQAAQELVEAAFSDIGFVVERIAVPDSIGDDTLAGVPAGAYAGRFDVLARSPQTEGRSLLVNGHIDVVPVNPSTWSSDPFVPVIRDGWLYGRGAGDMKAGFAMTVMALRALRRLGFDLDKHNLSFLSVIEEECTGNGTLAAVRAGITADAVILPEPTDLKILLGGIAITWVRVTVQFGGGHAEASDRMVSPAQVLAQLVEEFRDLEERYNKDVRPPFDVVARPYNVNVGVIQLGEWPSSVPAAAEIEVRVGHASELSDTDVLHDVRALVAEVLQTAGNPKFEIALHGFKAQGYYLSKDHPMVGQMAIAHAAMHGAETSTEVLGSTTDARYYLNQLDVPALCFGPVVKNMHGSDERVELASIEKGAATLARFIATYFEES